MRIIVVNYQRDQAVFYELWEAPEGTSTPTSSEELEKVRPRPLGSNEQLRVYGDSVVERFRLDRHAERFVREREMAAIPGLIERWWHSEGYPGSSLDGRTRPFKADDPEVDPGYCADAVQALMLCHDLWRWKAVHRAVLSPSTLNAPEAETEADGFQPTSVFGCPLCEFDRQFERENPKPFPCDRCPLVGRWSDRGARLCTSTGSPFFLWQSLYPVVPSTEERAAAANEIADRCLKRAIELVEARK